MESQNVGRTKPLRTGSGVVFKDTLADDREGRSEREMSQYFQYIESGRRLGRRGWGWGTSEES